MCVCQSIVFFVNMMECNKIGVAADILHVCIPYSGKFSFGAKFHMFRIELQDAKNFHLGGGNVIS